MLNHHSLSLLIHLSVLVLLRGEYLVNASRKVNITKNLRGTKATTPAMSKRAIANLRLA